MATQPYGLLVEESDDVFENNSDNLPTDVSGNVSQISKVHLEKDTNDSNSTAQSQNAPRLTLDEPHVSIEGRLEDNISSDQHSPGVRTTSFSSCWDQVRHNWTLFVVKPVLIFYGLQYAIQGPVTTQLWLEKTCLVDFKYNASICQHINDPKWRDIQNIVQKQVAEYQIVNTYLSGIPPIIIGLYLGPLSDRGRKLLMYLPFFGHTISGIFPFLVVYFDTCSPKYLWLNNLYVIFGGYTVLSIAMYGYIGDVTSQRNRTTIMSVLSGLGILIFPMAEFVGGQIFKIGGYYAVYGCSLAFNILGICYIYTVPESITRRTTQMTESDTNESQEEPSCCQKLASLIIRGNHTILEAYRCLTRERPNGMKRFIMGLLIISMVSGMYVGSWSSGLLFAERMFGWTVVDYTNYSSYAFVVVALRTFVTTPILCYVFGMHDCMLTIIGGLASFTTFTVMALATKGWMFYYAVSLSIIGGLTSTPLQSMLSKCVGKDEYGKIFTLSSVATSISSLFASVFVQKLYVYTVEYFPGAMYVFCSCAEMTTVILMSIFFYFVTRHEREFGVIGKDQDENKSD